MAEKEGPPPSYGESSSGDAGIPPPPPTYTEPTQGVSAAQPPPPPSYAEPTKGAAFGQPQPIQPVGAAFGQPQPLQTIQPTQSTTVVILQQPGSTNANFTNNIYPQRMQCPSCQAQITTRLEHTTGSCVWLWCVCLVFSGLFLFAWLPFVMNSCKDVHHYCPSCNHKCGYRGRSM